MKYDEAFRQALLNKIEPLGRGGQAEICKLTGLPSTVVCSIIKGRRPASELNKHKIAEALGYSYSDFIALGGYGKKEKRNNNVVPMRRRRDLDPQFAEAVKLLEDIYDMGKESNVLSEIILTISGFKSILKGVERRKLPSKS